jgi:ribosome-binding protein aMBF1 (putative translation factor)
MTKPYKTLSEFKVELLQDPEFKVAYEASQVEYELARSIIKARLDKGMTQTELATAMNTKQSVISRAENGGSIPSVSFLKRLAKALDIKLKIQLAA